MRRHLKWILVIVLLAAAVIVYLVTRAPQATRPPDGSVESWTVYASSRFRVQFRHPGHWSPVNVLERDRYDGYNGFFVVSALSGGYATVDQALGAVVGLQIRPYGTEPTVERLVVGGQDGRLVLPSADQPSEMNHEAVFVVAYPQPVRAGNELYRYAVLWADLDHIRAIVSTFGFSSQEVTALATASGKVVFDPVCLTIGQADEARRAAACTATPGAFRDRKILIYDESGKQLVRTVDLDEAGHYRVELESGNYVLDINYLGLDRSADVPYSLKLAPGATVERNVVIDTGTSGTPAK